jgi:hypothetical protein
MTAAVRVTRLTAAERVTRLMGAERVTRLMGAERVTRLMGAERATQVQEMGDTETGVLAATAGVTEMGVAATAMMAEALELRKSLHRLQLRQTGATDGEYAGVLDR